MINCETMKKGEIYRCEDCGLEIQVIKECEDSKQCADGSCGSESTFSCCGGDLVKKI